MKAEIIKKLEQWAKRENDINDVCLKIAKEVKPYIIKNGTNRALHDQFVKMMQEKGYDNEEIIEINEKVFDMLNKEGIYE